MTLHACALGARTAVVQQATGGNAVFDILLHSFVQVQREKKNAFLAPKQPLKFHMQPGMFKQIYKGHCV